MASVIFRLGKLRVEPSHVSNLLPTSANNLLQAFSLCEHAVESIALRFGWSPNSLPW